MPRKEPEGFEEAVEQILAFEVPPRKVKRQERKKPVKPTERRPDGGS